MTGKGVSWQASSPGRRPFGARLVLSGFAIIAVFLSGTAAWMLLAPLESAVVAPGVVGVETSRKTMQHLEGGIVEKIYVREGGRVAAGDILIRLQNTVPASVLIQLQGQFFEAQATEARLAAERDGLDEIAFPTDLREKVADQSVQAAMAGQRSIFESRRELLRERMGVLDHRIAGLNDEISGLEGQIRASDKQLVLIDEELESLLELYERKLIQKPQLLRLQRRQAEIEGAISGYRAAVARARQGIQEANLRKAELRATAATEVVEELRAVRARGYELAQRLAAARDVLRRTEIRSPIDGTVVGLKIHTVGGVVSAGQPLLDIVPSNDELVVQTSIDPLDIDQVRAGLPATVQLTALNRRQRRAIDGEVSMVSADRLTDPTTGFAYYLARVELDPESPGFDAAVLQPGMSADVMIRTGIRTPWEYIVAPITRVLGRGLREQ